MLLDKPTFQEEFKQRFPALLSKSFEEASVVDQYVVLAGMIREEMNERWAITNDYYLNHNEKQVYYFSLEFLVGKFLENNLLYLGAKEPCREGLAELGIDLDDLIACEPDAGLGNGGLGRLAACFLDSLACLGYPGHGNGIRYKYGLFKQEIVDGYQVELPDNWLRFSNPWEIRKPDKATVVHFNGKVRVATDESGHARYVHENFDPVVAVPYDMPILGKDNNTVNTLRLWSAEPMGDSFDYASFSRGDYGSAAQQRYQVEAISEVLYPDDSNYQNRILRLKQQYFFVSAGVQSIVRRFKKKVRNIRQLPDLITIHINDTHPALVVPELMRILMDEEGFAWDDAWDMTKRIVAYTNHTIMPEALETWPVDLFRDLLPRIYMIVEEINRRFRFELMQTYGNDWGKINNMAILDHDVVKMANLAVVGSFSVNGVAEVHTELIKTSVMKDLYEHFPDKFNNKTNGITHRRWLIKDNPSLTNVITDCIGDEWKTEPVKLEKMKKYLGDTSVHDKLQSIKRREKERLAAYIWENNEVVINPDSIFDVQIKRIHAYKRQLLNAIHIHHLYNKLKANPRYDFYPRTFIFAGKAAPSYYYAKSIIKYINELAKLINADKDVNDKMKVVFLANYNVALAEKVFPASDVSEQISTASKEASGTGNMKFMMNGAVTIGTNDGANVEIQQLVGPDNFILFGLRVEEVLAYYHSNQYSAWNVYENDPRIKEVIDQLISGCLFPYAPQEDFASIVRSLLEYNDEYFVLKDFASYAEAHQKIDTYYRDKPKWYDMSLTNIAMSGHFSSDNTIRKYAETIWHIRQCTPVDLPE